MNNLRTLIVSAQDGYAMPPRVQAQYFAKRKELLSAYMPQLTAMFSEAMIDDSVQKTPAAWLDYLVHRCETLVCKDGAVVVGIAVLSPVKLRHSTDLFIWIAPEYRSRSLTASRKLLAFWKEDILPHAFEHMKVARIETRCCVENPRAVITALRGGFHAIGQARLDLQIRGQLYDSVIFEYINPAYEIGEVEEKLHGRERAEPESIPDEHGVDGSGRFEQPPGRVADHEPALEPAV